MAVAREVPMVRRETHAALDELETALDSLALGRFDDALACCERLSRTLSRSGASGERRADVKCVQVQSLFELGRTQRALEEVAEEIELVPISLPFSRVALGLCVHVGDLDLGERVFRARWTAQRPLERIEDLGDGDLVRNYAVYFVKTQSGVEAAEEFLQAHLHSSLRTEALEELELAAERDGQIDDEEVGNAEEAPSTLDSHQEVATQSTTGPHRSKLLTGAQVALKRALDVAGDRRPQLLASAGLVLALLLVLNRRRFRTLVSAMLRSGRGVLMAATGL